MKKASNFRKIGMIFVLIMLCTIILNPISNAQQFSDLRPDHWCYNKIIDFKERGYVTGYDDGEFKPDRTITRAEYVTIVNNFFGYEANTENTAKFSDVSDEDWFEPYVSEAVKRGYISGYPDGTFKPYDPIRRQEATVILSKILNIADEEYEEDHEDGLAQYADGEEVEDWAYKAVHSYSVYNFINGYEDNTIRLFRNVTRAETVQLLNTVEEKVVIDRDNKTNEIKNRPSGGSKKRTATPVITVVEANDQNTWYNGEEAKGGNVTVKVTTTTKNATITVKVNGKVIDTTPFETEGSGVTFTLPEGKYEIIASAKRSSYKVSYDAKGEVDVDVTKPVVSGKLNQDETVTLSAYDNLSGVDSIQYAWFVKDGENYKRVSNWEAIKDQINLPQDAQNYYIGVKGSDIAGNKIDGGLEDNNIDDAKVTDGATNEPYDIVNEAKITDDKDKEQDQEDKPSATEFKITYHKNDGTDKTYIQKLTEGETVLKSDIFGRKEYKLIGWAEIATGDKVYELGATVNFNEDKDLYAVWKLNEPSDEPVIVEVKAAYTVKHMLENADGKTYEEDESLREELSGKVGSTVTATAKSIPHYTENTEKATRIPEGVVTSDGKLELVLYYSRNQYTITFDTDGGSKVQSITQKHGTEVTEPADPTKPGYTFVGWDKEVPTTMPTEDMTIKANWEKDENQWYTVTFKYGDNGTFDETKLVFEDVLKGSKLKDTDVVIPTPKANEGYEFDCWEPEEPKDSTVVDKDLTFTAKFKEKWKAPNITIDSFESTNVSNEVGNRAEPGMEIEYTVVITNNDEVDAIIDIDPERGMEVVSPSDYENIELAHGESITVKVKKKVLVDYSVADDFDAELDVIIKSDKTASAKTEKISDSTSNPIEKTVTVKLGESINKNIVLTIDTSRSMLYCCSHEKIDDYSYDKNFVIPDGVIDIFPKIDGKWSVHPYAGHYYNIGGGLKKKWVKCTDDSRINVVKTALTSFVDNIYNASVANGEKVTITLVTFDRSTSDGTTYLLSSENVAKLKEDIQKINATGSTRIDKGIETATKVFERNDMVKEGKVENYSIFFGDGDCNFYAYPSTEESQNLKNKVDYSYAIGFGPDFSDRKSDAYEVLENLIKGDGVTVTQAKTAADVTTAFADIANKIAISKQSEKGKIELELPKDNNYYPIIATYSEEGKIETLFTINNSLELELNDIVISGTTLTWNISGEKYSRYEGLSIKLGDQPQTLLAPLMMLNSFDMPVKVEIDIPTNNDGILKEVIEPEANSSDKSNANESKVEEPKVEEPKVEEPKVEEPKVEEPKAEEPKVEEPKVEEPKVEEPEVEEPKAEEPKEEQPKIPEEPKQDLENQPPQGDALGGTDNDKTSKEPEKEQPEIPEQPTDKEEINAEN